MMWVSNWRPNLANQLMLIRFWQGFTRPIQPRRKTLSRGSKPLSMSRPSHPLTDPSSAKSFCQRVKMNEPKEPSPAFLKLFPGLLSLRGYRREWLLPDLLAGISVCVVMIPSVIAYSGLMGLPPQHGLYAALVPLILYAFFGSSRQVIVGPDIALALLTANA